jgi:hypothetical protein
MAKLYKYLVYYVFCFILVTIVYVGHYFLVCSHSFTVCNIVTVQVMEKRSQSFGAICCMPWKWGGRTMLQTLRSLNDRCV